MAHKSHPLGLTKGETNPQNSSLSHLTQTVRTRWKSWDAPTAYVEKVGFRWPRTSELGRMLGKPQHSPDGPACQTL